MSDSELDAAVIESQKQVDRQLAKQAALLAEWDARKIWTSDQSKSAASRFARETGVSVGDAGALVRRAKRLVSMPLSFEAFASGSLASSRVNLLCRANRPEVRALFERDEQTLLDNIGSLSFADAARLIRYWSQHADESGSKKRADRLVEQRSAHLSKTFEGTVDLRALFDPVSGEAFFNEHERLERHLFQEDWAAAKELYGDDVRVEDLKRSPAQRRCDALRLMAERSAASQPGVKPKPLITVVVDRDTLGRVCELASGTVIDPGQVVPLLSEAEIERIVFDGPSRVIDLGCQRSFKGALRRVLEIRDRHCMHESGCDEPAKNCEGDHVFAHSRGGSTNQFNGQLMCGRHNRSKGSGPP